MKKAINFWSTLGAQAATHPIYALAPMAGVTDSPFRQLCKKFGADVVYSELASATALNYAPEKTLELLAFDEAEHPYVAQLFGSKPEHFAHAAKLLSKELKPDGIDINFGCPVKKVQKQGAGAILMTDLELSYKVIKSVIDSTDLPVSVKIRAQAGKIDALAFLDKMADLPIAAVMIHGRTMAQGHSGTVDWKIIKDAREHFSGVLLANGGVVDKQSADELLANTGADGLGIARGALGKPWIFSQLRINNYELPINRIFEIAIEHAKLVEKTTGKLGIIEMRKHLCWYVAGLPGASEMRKELVKVENFKQITDILKF